MQTPQCVQLMNIVSNFIFHCNNCDANRVFAKFRENANQHGCRADGQAALNAKFTFKGRPHQSFSHG